MAADDSLEDRIRREITGAVVRPAQQPPESEATGEPPTAVPAPRTQPPPTTRSRHVERVMLVVITALVTLALTYVGAWLVGGKNPASAPPSGSAAAPAPMPVPAPPPPKTPLELFAESHELKSVQGDAVFVTKGVYGGDLQYSAILRGKIRNVSTRPLKDVLVLWLIYGADQLPFVVSGVPGGPSVFLGRVEYLDTKAEADFNITVDLYGGLSMDSAIVVREALRAGRHEAGLYVKGSETAL